MESVSKPTMKKEMNSKVINAMQRNDLAEVVLSHKLTTENYLFNKQVKSEEYSNKLRSIGNTHFHAQNLRQAMYFYNQALMYAPESSLAMKLAYSNRSAIYLATQLGSACLNDVERCFSLGCPKEIKSKLLYRKEQVTKLIHQEHFNKCVSFNSFTNDFFKFDVKRNHDIPSAIADLEVILDDNMPKVVAKNDIKVGTVMAVETAFVVTSKINCSTFCCYYCTKMSLNLIPCLGCTHAMFCNEECRERCLADYHSIECLIITAIHPLFTERNIDLALKATLKFKNKIKTWNKFVEASYNMGQERISKSMFKEIYDSDNPLSLLTFSDKHHFIYGKMYKFSSICAFIIENLKQLKPSFFPQSIEERNTAIKAFARIFLYLAVYGNSVFLSTSLSNIKTKINYIRDTSFGLFSFCSKLKMSCHANALTVSLNKDVALIAMQPIPAGTELTIPFMETAQLPYEPEQMKKHIFKHFYTLCNCKNCNDKDDHRFESGLNYFQNQTLMSLMPLTEQILERNLSKEKFEFLCAKMHVFSDFSYTKSNVAYCLFREFIMHLQAVVLDNKLLEDANDDVYD